MNPRNRGFLANSIERLIRDQIKEIGKYLKKSKFENLKVEFTGEKRITSLKVSYRRNVLPYA